MLNPPFAPPPSSKRKAGAHEGAPKPKRSKPTVEVGKCTPSSPSKASVTLKLGPKPPEPEPFQCCLCVSMSHEGLLRVQDPPIGKRELPGSLSSIYDATKWMAHEECAKVVPETWIDTVELPEILPDGSHVQESRVFGVDAIVKDRWNLVWFRFASVAPVVMMCFRNVRLAARDDKRHTVPLSNAQKESVPSHSTFPVQEKGRMVFLTPCCVRSRRK